MNECKKAKPTSAKNTQQMQGSLLAFFHICLMLPSVLPLGASLLEMKFSRNFFHIVSVLFGGGRGSKPTFKQNLFRDNLCYSTPNTISHCSRTRLLLLTRQRSNFSHITHSQLPATSKQNSCRDVLNSETGSITLSYSPPSTLSHCRHPQAIPIYIQWGRKIKPQGGQELIIRLQCIHVVPYKKDNH